MAAPISHKPFILFITGTSASGKTTLYESLRKDPAFSDIEFHDIDEGGVPPVGRLNWRAFRVEELLYEAVMAQDKGTSTVICGITKPHEIVESQYFKPANNIHFLLVKVPYELLENRITERVGKQAKTGEFDESFNPDALKEILQANKKLLKELENMVTQQKNGHSLDVSKLSKVEMHDRAVRLIDRLRNK